MELFVFSSKRALQSFYQASNATFLPEALSIEEFFNSLLVVENKRQITSSLRALLLWSVVQEMPIEKIGFDKTFLRFLEDSRFLLQFFNELESSMVKLENIDLSDTYGDYEDHLRLLSRIYEKYQEVLKQYNFYDSKRDFCLHSGFLEYYQDIHIFIDGVLSKSDFHILQCASKHANIDVTFVYDRYNAFMFERIFEDLKKQQKDCKYTYSINDKRMLSALKTQPKLAKVELYLFDVRLNQSMLVVAKVNEWLKEGIENIAVIVPDESFVSYLQIFDSARNLNYAMGLSLHLKNILQDIARALECDSAARSNKLKHIAAQLEKHKLLEHEMQKMLLEMRALEDFFEKLSYDDIVEYIACNLPKIDDTSGGKVKVIGILESRGMSFERAVVVDFNEEFVPKLSDNDMFLNTNIRKNVLMPTLKDKENLQRHYYYQLFNNTKEIAISFCRTSAHSSMLDELARDNPSFHAGQAINGDEKWRFFPPSRDVAYIDDEFCMGESSTDSNGDSANALDSVESPQSLDSINASAESSPCFNPSPHAKIRKIRFSPTSLKMFIDCELKFYFSYIMFGRRESSSAATIGNLIHNALQASDDFSYKSIENTILSSDITRTLELDIASKKDFLVSFLRTQRECLKHRKIIAKEQDYAANICGFECRCRVDRVDRENDKIYIIDYKCKNNFDIKKEGYLQLLICKKALERVYGDCEVVCEYADVYRDRYYPMSEENQKEAMDLLEQALQKLQDRHLVFTKCDPKSHVCKYCDFVYLCNRY